MVQHMTDRTPCKTEGIHCMADGIFGDLKEIEGARDTQARPTTNLERLLELERRFVAEVASEVREREAKNNFTLHGSDALRIFGNKLCGQELSNIDFNERDLKTLVLTMVNSDYDSDESRKALGLYTGILLQSLTEKNVKQGKRTRVYINGYGNRFDYLFYACKHVDELVLENFTGDYICSSMGVSDDNLEGAGFIGRLVGIHLNGIEALNVAGYSTQAKQIIGIDIRGRNGFSSIGRASGKTNQIIGVDIAGTAVFTDIGVNYGCVNQIIGVDILSDTKERLRPYLELERPEDANYNEVICSNVSPQHILKSCRRENSGASKETYNSFIDYTPKENKLYWKLLRTAGLDRVGVTIALARSMKGKPYQEVLKIADQLYALCPQAPDGFFGKSNLFLGENK